MKKMFFLLSLLIALPLQSAESWWLGIGKGMSDALIQSQNTGSLNVLQAGLRFDSDYQLDNGLLSGGQLAIETYITRLDGETNLTLLAVRPLLQFDLSDNSHSLPLIWQMGLGVAWFSDDELESVTLSTRAQFALVGGVGLWLDKKKQQKLMLRYNHYSNAYIRSPNQGLDYVSLDWQQNF